MRLLFEQAIKTRSQAGTSTHRSSSDLSISSFSWADACSSRSRREIFSDKLLSKTRRVSWSIWPWVKRSDDSFSIYPRVSATGGSRGTWA
jgi:hypothetical protein